MFNWKESKDKPKNDDFVLAVNKDNVYCIVYYNREYKKFIDYDDFVFDVVYWMPLPESPNT